MSIVRTAAKCRKLQRSGMKEVRRPPPTVFDGPRGHVSSGLFERAARGL